MGIHFEFLSTWPHDWKFSQNVGWGRRGTNSSHFSTHFPFIKLLRFSSHKGWKSSSLCDLLCPIQYKRSDTVGVPSSWEPDCFISSFFQCSHCHGKAHSQWESTRRKRSSQQSSPTSKYEQSYHLIIHSPNGHIHITDPRQDSRKNHLPWVQAKLLTHKIILEWMA